MEIIYKSLSKIMNISYNIQDSSLIDDIGPEKIIAIRDPKVGLESVLVIDNSAYGIPAGGVRLAPDITVDEMARLARAMSLKFASYQMKIGGAKAGIWADPKDKEKKDLLITAFGKAIEKYITDDIYYPGPDMNTTDEDMLKIFNVIGAPELAPNPLEMEKQGVPVEVLFTGYGVIYCLDAIHKNYSKFYESSKDLREKPKIILEGFGKVGTGIAMSLDELGYKLTGLSTLRGAIYDDEGLDLQRLLELRSEFGDDVVNEYESENLIRVEKEKLFELSSEYSVDYLIPGARPDVINETNIDKIEAKAIVPAANIPYEKGIIPKLEEKNIIPFPDFVANAGEILAILVNKVAKNADEIFEYIREKITSKTLDVLKGAKEENSSEYHFAKEFALKELNKKLRRKKRKIEKLNKRY
ncbi:MAG: putative NADP-specific glutamate dehydrogenase [Promethearchaeota archaeon]|nr:MAG: putative NADP-specific glutamate dehydrogenase [Candidatus Lokiarchaeota archaeon]